MSISAPSVPLVPGTLLLGSLPDFRSRRVEFQLRVAREQGPVARARLGLFEVLIVSSAQLAGKILADQADDFVKSYGLSLFARPLLGNGLLTSERDDHKRQRRLLAPAFVHKRIAAYVDIMAERAEAAAARMLEAGSVDVSAETMQLTLEIVGKALFDADVGSSASAVGQALTSAMECVIDSLTSLVPLPPSVPSPTNLRLRRAVRELDRVVYAMIDERRRQGGDRGDMLSLLLASRDEDGSGMTDQQVRDEAMTAFLAGHETTANALAWALVLLARHPDIRERAVAEIDRELGSAPITLDALERVPLCLRILKEAMRLYPPVYFVGRRATHDLTIDGIPFRKNQVVLINIAGIHRRPEDFPNPEVFDPDRFLKAREQALPRHAFMPFGGGPRMCIGNHFALLEGQLILASWLRRMQLELVTPAAAIELEPLITLRPKGEVRMRVSARSIGSAARVPERSVAG